MSYSRSLQYLQSFIAFIIVAALLGFIVPQQMKNHYSLVSFPMAERMIAIAQKFQPLNDLLTADERATLPIVLNTPDGLSDISQLYADSQAKQDYLDKLTRPYYPSSANPLHYDFTTPPALTGMVNFWIAIFGRYGKNQFVFHYADNVGVVYSILDLNESFGEGLTDADEAKLRREALSAEKKRIAALLKGMVDKLTLKEPFNFEEQRIADMLLTENIPITSAADAAKIRIQEGYNHRFRQAIVQSGQYMDEIERIFIDKGLPIELTRIPFVESAFNVKAVSSASAAGLWQFIPESGKKYLQINDIIDERFDPILSTHAAAQHLKNDFDLLGSWELAVNAYNTGPGRIQRAMNALGTTDIAVIVKNYSDDAYQFYSRNYYPEFLAALYVYNNQQKFFGPINKMAPMTYDMFFPSMTINVKSLSESLNVSMDTMRKLNPAFSDDVMNGLRDLPPGYMLKVPQGMSRDFNFAALNIVDPIGTPLWHLVEEGETLETIAQHYEIDAEALKTLNNISDDDLQPGLIIKIPQDLGMAENPGN